MRCIFLRSVDLFATLLALSLLSLIYWVKWQLSVYEAHPLSPSLQKSQGAQNVKICWTLFLAPVYPTYFPEDENQGTG